MRILCIVPFQNEERHLPAFLASLAAQQRPAEQTLLVDDGSSDDSPRIAAEFTERKPSVRLLRRPPRPPARDRLAGAPELAAFQWAITQAHVDWDVVVKLDADLLLSPDLFHTLERALVSQPDFGIAGTYLAVVDRDTGQLRRERCPQGHVRGATKFYRRACYEQISPVPAVLGWDTIDEVAARSRGWRTGSLPCAAGDTVHLRPTGEQNGRLRAQLRWGRCAYGIGQHPVWVMLSALRRGRARPIGLGALAFIAGWLAARFQRAPRAPRELRAFVREEELQSLRRLAASRSFIRGGGVGPDPEGVGLG